MKLALHDSPFGRAFFVGRIRGIEVLVHWSVAVIFVLLVFTLDASVFPETSPGRSQAVYLLTALVSAVFFLLALLAHELAHAVTALRQGHSVKRITLWMLGGLTEMVEGPTTAKRAAQVAGAGPLMSLVLAFGFGAAALGLQAYGGAGMPVEAFVWLSGTNLMLGLFNLLPALPLDGGRVFESVLWWRLHDRVRSVRIAARGGLAFGYLMLGFGLVSVISGQAGGLWLCFLGLFISSAAQSEKARASMLAIEDRPVEQFMVPVIATAPAWQAVDDFVDTLSAEAGGRAAFPVVDIEGRLVGLLSWEDLMKVPREYRHITPTSQAMHPLEHVAVCEPGESMRVVLQKMRPSGWAVVTRAGVALGTVDVRDVFREKYEAMVAARH